MSADLHIASKTPVAPQEIATLIAALPRAQQAILALLYCPDRCVLARVTEQGAFEAPRSGPIDAAAAYEIVAFCPAWEFHWLREGPAGSAWLLSEEALLLGDAKSQPVANVRDNTVNYLVWGERDKSKSAQGSVTVSAGQIGEIVLPVDAIADEYVLRAIEYFIEDPVHGNVTVGVQRLVAIEPYVPPKAKGADDE